MILDLVVPRKRLRRWHLDLARQLGSRAGRTVRLRPGHGPALPAGIERLFAFERWLYRLPSPRASDPAEAPRPSAGDAGAADLTIDLGPDGEPPAGPGPRLRVRYEGLGDETAIVAALLAGRAPVVGIEEARDGRILARGLPSIENGAGIAGGYEAVVARVPTLIEKALQDPAAPGLEPLPPRSGSASAAAAARHALRSVAIESARRLYRLSCHAPHWKVGWRFVADGGVWEHGSLEGAPWRVVPDPGDRFYADPFPIVWRGQSWVLVEDFPHATQKGVISAIRFGETGPVGPGAPVLEEPWHLSYPFLVEEAGEVFMIPESSASRAVTLYRAVEFPRRWELAAHLVEGVEASDATLVRKDGRWWLFAATRDGAGAHSDTLSLYVSDALLGPWRPHPANPVLVDAASARPAGNMVWREGRLWRPVQDCRAGYGAALGLAEVLRLDEGGFEQVVRHIVAPGPLWPGRKLHTLNRAGNLEVIDGSRLAPKLGPALGRVLTRPRADGLTGG